MRNSYWKNPLMLFLTAVIWGIAFVAQSVGMEYVGAFTFNSTRCIIGGFVLIPCIFLLDRLKGRKKGEETSASGGMAEGKKEWRILLIGGICCGVALFVASNLQQFGIQYTSVGKAGFITAMYIVLVPVMGIFLKKTIGMNIWISVILAVAGLYLLCITEGFSIGRGDILVLLCALVFSIHILVIDYFSPKVDGVKMSCIQFFVCGILSGIGMLIWETPTLHAIMQAWVPILYAGVMSCGVAYTLQILGQKGMNPTVASLILSLESVVSVIAGWLLLGQNLSMRELLGCVLMFAAIVLAQLPQRKNILMNMRTDMDYTIREMKETEYSLLNEFLYEAIFIPEGLNPPPMSIIHEPELQVYVSGFGLQKHDRAFVAEVEGKIVGAVWVRIMNDYGHIDNRTPSFAISLYKEYRGQGIGTEMMRKMLSTLKDCGYEQVSLAVQKANYAVKMYQKVGFEIIDENEEEYIMVNHL